MNDEYEYLGFISYNRHTDRYMARRIYEWVREVAGALDKPNRPPDVAKPVRAFLDTAELGAIPLRILRREIDSTDSPPGDTTPPSSDLLTALEQEIDASKHFILLASPNAALSKWVNLEVKAWYAKERGADRNFFVALTKGADITWDAIQERAQQITEIRKLDPSLVLPPDQEWYEDNKREDLKPPKDFALPDELVSWLTVGGNNVAPETVDLRLYKRGDSMLGMLARTSLPTRLMEQPKLLLNLMLTPADLDDPKQLEEERRKVASQFRYRTQLVENNLLPLKGYLKQDAELEKVLYSDPYIKEMPPEFEEQLRILGARLFVKVSPEKLSLFSIRAKRRKKWLYGIVAAAGFLIIAVGTLFYAIIRINRERQALAESDVSEIGRLMYTRTLLEAQAQTRTGHFLQARAALQHIPEDLRGFDWRLLNLMAMGYTQTSGADVRLTADPSGSQRLSVYSVAYSPDGKLLAAGNRDGTIQVWDTTDMPRSVAILGDVPSRQIAVRTASVHSAERQDEDHLAVRSVAFAQDGTALAAGGEDGRMRIWSLVAGQPDDKPRSIISVGDGAVNVVSYSGDGRWLAVGSDGPEFPEEGSGNGRASKGQTGTVKLYDPATGRLRGTLRVGSSVKSIAFSPDSRILAVGARDNTITLWDVQTRSQRGHLPVHPDTICAVAFSPDGSLLATGSMDGHARLWDWRRNRLLLDIPVGEAPLSKLVYPVLSLAFSPNGEALATGGGLYPNHAGNGVKLWSTQTGELLRAWGNDTDPVYSLAFNRGGDTLAIGGWEPLVSLWRLEPQNPQTFRAGGKLYTAAVSAKGEMFACGSINQVYLWRGTSGAQTIPMPAHRGAVFATATNRDGNLLLTAGNGGDWQLWQLNGHWSLAHWEKNASQGQIYAAALSQDGTMLATAGKDGMVRAWNWDMAAKIPVPRPVAMAAHQDTVKSVALDRVGRRLVSGGEDGICKVWDLSPQGSFEPIRDFPQSHAGEISSVAISLDGNRIVAGTAEKRLIVWSYTDDRGWRRQEITQEAGILAVAISSDGNNIATGGDDGAVRICNVAVAPDLWVLKRFPHPIRSVAFSDDNTKLIAVSDSREVYLWLASKDSNDPP